MLRIAAPSMKAAVGSLRQNRLLHWKIPNDSFENSDSDHQIETAYSFLPQVAEIQTPQAQDASGEYLLYHKSMTRVYIADARLEERSALRLLLLDLKMEVVGEAADWITTLANAPATGLDMLLIDWDKIGRAHV